MSTREAGEMSDSATTTTCIICEQPHGFRWTDTHGIGACTTCGAPYRLYHYEDDQRVERPPETLLMDWWIPFARRYWQEHRRNVDPGAYNFPGSDYEVAAREDYVTFDEWVEAHRAEIEAAATPDGNTEPRTHR